MGYNILKTRKGKLEAKLKAELASSKPSLENMLKFVDDYEKDNLSTIKNLKRDKSVDTKRINGALHSTIKAHGPITKLLIGSATKRIYGALLENKPKTKIISAMEVSWQMFQLTVWIGLLTYFIYNCIKII